MPKMIVKFFIDKLSLEIHLILLTEFLLDALKNNMISGLRSAQMNIIAAPFAAIMSRQTPQPHQISNTSDYISSIKL